jgi:hypothetical protein
MRELSPNRKSTNDIVVFISPNGASKSRREVARPFKTNNLIVHLILGSPVAIFGLAAFKIRHLKVLIPVPNTVGARPARV